MYAITKCDISIYKDKDIYLGKITVSPQQALNIITMFNRKTKLLAKFNNIFNNKNIELLINNIELL